MNTRGSGLLFIIFVVLSVILIGLTSYERNKANSDLNRVKAVCDTAHNEINGKSEDDCAVLQEETNTEYLCNRTGELCWVEKKY